jgi:Asp-tRNA(Asn)/Glu-tRNA(Gln) amidotransferase A subunit family amidase
MAKGKLVAVLALVGLTTSLLVPAEGRDAGEKFDVMEATIDQIHDAIRSGRLTAHELIQDYLDRIQAYDKEGPSINCMITVNKSSLADADKLDAEFKKTGKLVAPLHGIPIVIKDQVDTAGMPTTLGSLVFKDYLPPEDSFVVAKLRKAGAIILGKATLGEFGAGDAYGSLFGITRNPYDPKRTVGGSSGGSGACVSSNFATAALGQEGFASIRRPSAWNSIVGMRPSPGLVSRTGVYGGWPAKAGQVGPMARTVKDMATLLDSMVGYDKEDPMTSLSIGNVPNVSYASFLDKNGLKGARIGVLRQSMGYESEPGTPDFLAVDGVFSTAVNELKAAGAILVDPIVVPDLNKLMATRAYGATEAAESLKLWLSRNPNSRYKSMDEVKHSQEINKVIPAPKMKQWASPPPPNAEQKYHEYLVARDELAFSIWNIMAENKLDALVFKTVEHTPTLIQDGLNPPFYNQHGTTSLNTFVIYAAAMSVPAGFTKDNLPVGITFFGRPFTEPTLLKLAYSYEQATHHRVPPKIVPDLAARKGAPGILVSKGGAQ